MSQTSPEPFRSPDARQEPRVTLADDRALERFPSHDPATGEVLETWPVDDETTVGEAVDRARLAALWWADLGLRRPPRAPARLEGRHHPADARARPARAPRERQAGRRRHAGDHRRASTTSTGPPSTPRRSSGRASVRPSLLVGEPAGDASSTSRSASSASSARGTTPCSPRWARSPTRSRPATPWSSSRPSSPRGSAPGWSACSARSCPSTRCSSWSPATAVRAPRSCRAGVDKIAFTGSTRTGKKVMAACAETLTPVLMECGGKDAMIVDEDADLGGRGRRRGLGRRAPTPARPASGIERVYVVDSVLRRLPRAR